MYLRIFLILFMVFISLSAYGQVPEKGYFKFINDSYESRTPDNRKILIDECKQYLNIFPDSPDCPEILFHLGNLFLEEKMYRESFVTFMKIKHLYSNSSRQNDATAAMNQIMLKHAERTFKNQRSQIIEHITRPISTAAPNVSFYNYLNYLHELNIEEINRVIPAEIDYYLHIYSKDAKNVDQLLFWSAQIHASFKNWHEAINNYQKLIQLLETSPLVADAFYNIAVIQYKEISEYQKARDTFVSLIANFTQNPLAGQAQFYLAELYHEKLDNNDEAIANYRLLVETYPENENAVLALHRVAEIYEDLDRFEEAIAAYYQIFELYPKDKFAPHALLEIENIYRKKFDNYEKAIESLKLYAAQYPQLENAAEKLFDAGDIYEDTLENKEAAIQTYQQLIKQFPGSKYAGKAQSRIDSLTKK